MKRDVFKAIADPIRRDIIELVAEESLTINDIANKFEVSRPAISKHLKILNECGIIDFNKQGRERYCQILPQNLLPRFFMDRTIQKLVGEPYRQFRNLFKHLKK